MIWTGSNTLRQAFWYALCSLRTMILSRQSLTAVSSRTASSGGFLHEMVKARLIITITLLLITYELLTRDYFGVRDGA